MFWTVDLAITEKTRSDYTVFGRWQWRQPVLTLVQGRRFRAQWPEVKRQLKALMVEFPGEIVYFPKDSLEILAVQALKSEGFAAQVGEVSMSGDKVARATALSDLGRNGNVVVCSGEFGDYFVHECCSFPDSLDHDDCVDMSSVATHHLGLHRPFSLSVVSVGAGDKAIIHPYLEA